MIVFSGCKTNESKNISTSKLEVIKVPNKYEDIIFDQNNVAFVKVIPLETHKECLISEITNLTYTHDRFYIFDVRLKSLLVFDSNGRFIFKLIAAGRGPGEFHELRDFKIDNNGDIYILSYNKILIYSNQGVYIKSISFNFIKEDEVQLNPLQFSICENGFFLWQGHFAINYSDDEDHYALFKVNKRMTIEDKYFKIVRPIRGLTNKFFGEYNNYYLHCIRGNDTIFRTTDEGLLPSYFVDFGERKIPDNYLPEGFEGLGKIYSEVRESNYSTLIIPYAETEKYFYSEFQSENNWIQLLYNKNTKFVKVGKRDNTNLFSSAIRCSAGDKLVTYVEPNRIISGNFTFDTNPEVEIKNIESLQLLQDHDNPVLMIYSLK